MERKHGRGTVQRVDSKQVLVDAVKQLVILTLRVHPMVNGHFYPVNKVDDSLARLPGLDTAPSNFFAVLNFKGLHFADADRVHLLTLPFVQIYRW
jgi:hypothetical protein